MSLFPMHPELTRDLQNLKKEMEKKSSTNQTETEMNQKNSTGMKHQEKFEPLE